MNFTVLWLFAIDFSTKFGGMASVGAAKGSNLQTLSPQKSFFFLQFAKVFSLKSFSLYGMTHTKSLLSRTHVKPSSSPDYLSQTVV